MRYFPNSTKEKNFHAQFKSKMEEGYPERPDDEMWDDVIKDDEIHDYSTYPITLPPSQLASDEKCALPHDDNGDVVSKHEEGSVNPEAYQF